MPLYSGKLEFFAFIFIFATPGSVNLAVNWNEVVVDRWARIRCFLPVVVVKDDITVPGNTSDEGLAWYSHAEDRTSCPMSPSVEESLTAMTSPLSTAKLEDLALRYLRPVALALRLISAK